MSVPNGGVKHYIAKPGKLMEQMIELNQRMSISTAYSTWKEEFHIPMRCDEPTYNDLFTDTCYLITEWNDGDKPGDVSQQRAVEDIAERLFYILSMSPDPTISLATVVSKLDTDCIMLDEDYQGNMQLYSELVYYLRAAKIFQYGITANGHPVLTLYYK